MQASHDAHGTVLDGIEDHLISHEMKSTSSLVSFRTMHTAIRILAVICARCLTADVHGTCM